MIQLHAPLLYGSPLWRPMFMLTCFRSAQHKGYRTAMLYGGRVQHGMRLHLTPVKRNHNIQARHANSLHCLDLGGPGIHSPYEWPSTSACSVLSQTPQAVQLATVSSPSRSRGPLALDPIYRLEGIRQPPGRAARLQRVSGNVMTSIASSEAQQFTRPNGQNY